MVRSSVLSWKIVNNCVGDRMIDGSLNHMFTERRRIRRKTQILNREFRQLFSINNYKKYVKMKKSVSRIISNDDDTDEDYLSDNDFDDAHKFMETVDNYDNYNDKITMDHYSDIDEEESHGEDDDREILTQFFDEEVPSEPNTDEVAKNIDESFESQVEYSPIREDIKHNIDNDLNTLAISDAHNAIVPGDSGIDDDSLDSPYANDNRLEKQQEIIEKSDDQIIRKKCQPKIMCTEIVTSKYKILRSDKFERENRNTNENLFNNSFDRETANCFDDGDLSPKDIKVIDDNELKKQSIALTIPSEIDALKYILRSLHINNRYKNDFFTNNNHCCDVKKNEEYNTREDNDVVSSRPLDLEDLIEDDDLSEITAETTMTFGDITEDDEIILMEIPKSIIDNRELKGKGMRIKKRSVFIDDTKYESYCKQNDELCCILKMKEDDVDYEIGSIVPTVSIVIRQKLAPNQMDESTLVSNSGEKDNFVPFPKNLKRRNPLVLQSDYHNNDLKRKWQSG